MSIARQVQYLRFDRSDTITALNERGVDDISRHGFDHFANDIRAIPSEPPANVGDLTVIFNGACVFDVGIIEIEE